MRRIDDPKNPGAGICDALEEWLAAGRTRIGQVAILKEGEGFSLLHEEDLGKSGLRSFSRPEEAREIARFDDNGKYRALKSAPNLRHGWALNLRTIAEVKAALDSLYPAMLGTFLAHERGGAKPVDFRETANRQTGMYAIVARISSAQADAVIGSVCASATKCLKTILWRIDAEAPVSKLPPEKFDPAADQTGNRNPGSIPLLCCEACNILVAEARTAVRAALDKARQEKEKANGDSGS